MTFNPFTKKLELGVASSNATAPPVTSNINKTKLQANDLDWVNDLYLGGTSGVITGSIYGEEFLGIQILPPNQYYYKTLGPNIWIRIFRG